MNDLADQADFNSDSTKMEFGNITQPSRNPTRNNSVNDEVTTISRLQAMEVLSNCKNS